MPTSTELLEEAAATHRERAETYGPPNENFARIATLWNAYSGQTRFGPRDVAMLLALVKVARQANDPGRRDNYVDLAGYAAIAGELSS